MVGTLRARPRPDAMSSGRCSFPASIFRRSRKTSGGADIVIRLELMRRILRRAIQGDQCGRMALTWRRLRRHTAGEGILIVLAAIGDAGARLDPAPLAAGPGTDIGPFELGFRNGA